MLLSEYFLVYTTLHMTPIIYTAGMHRGMAYSLSMYYLTGQYYYIHIYILAIIYQWGDTKLLLQEFC